jgi:hypothetical protein
MYVLLKPLHSLVQQLVQLVCVLVLYIQVSQTLFKFPNGTEKYFINNLGLRYLHVTLGMQSLFFSHQSEAPAGPADAGPPLFIHFTKWVSAKFVSVKEFLIGSNADIR